METHSNPTTVRLVNTKELAEILGVHWRTVRRHVRADDLPYIRVGRQYRFDVQEVLEALRGADR